jgi:hypothetical protein
MHRDYAGLVPVAKRSRDALSRNSRLVASRHGKSTRRLTAPREGYCTVIYAGDQIGGPCKGIYEWTTASVVLKKTTVLEYKDDETWKGKACSEAKAGDQQGMPSVERLSKQGNKLIPKTARRRPSLQSFVVPH